MNDWHPKAEENLEVARLILSMRDGGGDGWPNASASRAYYAAYQAVITQARAHGFGFTGRARESGAG